MLVPLQGLLSGSEERAQPHSRACQVCSFLEPWVLWVLEGLLGMLGTG